MKYELLHDWSIYLLRKWISNVLKIQFCLKRCLVKRAGIMNIHLNIILEVLKPLDPTDTKEQVAIAIAIVWWIKLFAFDALKRKKFKTW